MVTLGKSYQRPCPGTRAERCSPKGGELALFARSAWSDSLATGALRSLPRRARPASRGVSALKTAFRRHRMLLIALVLGTSAFALSLSVVSSYVKSEPVVVALKDLEPYRRIVAGDVAMREMPVKAVPRGCLKKVSDAVGCHTRSRLVAGQIVMGGHVAGDRAEAGLSYDLPVDRRGIFLPVPAGKAVGGALKQGERVDLIVVDKRFGSSGSPADGAATAVKGLHVLDVVREPSSGEFLGVVVLVLPRECELIARHLEEGSVYLSLVPRLAPVDEQRTEVWRSR